jgi:transposase-like protein
LESEEFKSIRDKALQQLMSGQSLTGKDGVFAPLLKQFLESALDGEMAAHLNEHERSQNNKRNGKGAKTLKTSDGMVTISTPQDRRKVILNLRSSRKEKPSLPKGRLQGSVQRTGLECGRAQGFDWYVYL